MSYPSGYYQPPGYYQPSDAYYRPTAPPQPTQNLQATEQEYVEQILRFNRGRFAKVHMTFPGASGSGGGVNKTFFGMILSAARDHIILKDFENNRSYLLLMVYLDYVEFDGFLNYILPPKLSPEMYQLLAKQNKEIEKELQEYLNISTAGTFHSI